jgi:hypothetical protein
MVVTPNVIPALNGSGFITPGVSLGIRRLINRGV